ncbi:MAG: metal-sensitive transcriptional regulator [Actinomycetota bacterium]
MYLYGESKDELLARLRRIEGQVRGLQRMVEQDKYCVDILTQISAVRAATEKVALHILSAHIRGCVKDAMCCGDNVEEKVQELAGVVERFLKT